jgi:anti-sigma factor RsiW
MSASPCEQVEAFHDGQLAPAEAESFRQHAADCTACVEELVELAQLDAAMGAALERKRRGQSYVCWKVDAFLSRRLKGAERKEFEAHLEGCGRCTEVVRGHWLDEYRAWRERQRFALLMTALFAVACCITLALVLGGGG